VAKYAGGFAEWEEYLLFAPRTGYRWLVNARGHYSFVSPLAPGAVEEWSTRASYGNRYFRLFDRGSAEVSGVWGEFYWKVTLGEAVQTADYVAPPAMLSRESSAAELHWSLGIYQTLAEVRAAFDNPDLPDETRGVAAHQPFRHAHWLHASLLLGALLMIIVFVLRASSAARQVYVGSFHLGEHADSSPSGAIDASSVAASPYIFFTPPFELEARQNTSVRLELPLINDWAYATVDLVHEESGELRSYGTELSFYSGVEGGESWSEGSRETEHLFGAGQAGSHVLRLELQTPRPSRDRLDVSVAQDVFALGQFGWVLLTLAVPAGLLGLAHYLFERARWSESDFAPSHYRSSDD